MGTVHGPYSPDDWFTMLEMKRLIAWMKDKDTKRYDLSIRHEERVLKDSYLTRQAA